ncbi:hypothetical protein I7I53_10009 [Histoplasma capsulatum var. duboisii H88]|uniref:Uncharacterized protein n=1 Tax=Ajellomyces capsulatus (strain H88) TaxID=544711 RepID=A0A8A1LCW9_AJEC8|nr:hypothetical protein I7I53_10009 [Histoplasma capsulatum var. duboisii H88]
MILVGNSPAFQCRSSLHPQPLVTMQPFSFLSTSVPCSILPYLILRDIIIVLGPIARLYFLLLKRRLQIYQRCFFFFYYYYYYFSRFFACLFLSLFSTA